MNKKHATDIAFTELVEVRKRINRLASEERMTFNEFIMKHPHHEAVEEFRHLKLICNSCTGFNYDKVVTN